MTTAASAPLSPPLSPNLPLARRLLVATYLRTAQPPKASMIRDELLDFLGKIAEKVLGLVENRYQMAFLGGKSGDEIRELLVELLAWQFASPVRWIETQKVLIDSGVEEIVEVGLASSPTLANLASKTLALPENAGANVTVFNLQRDAKRVLHEDVAKIAAPEEPAVAVPEPSAVQGAPAPVEQSAPAESMTSPARPPARS